jgi:hypothetical protein
LSSTHSVFSLECEVLSNITANEFPNSIHLIAIDDREHSDFFWKTAWTLERRTGVPFIIVMSKKGKVKATYEAKFPLHGDLEFDEKRKQETTKALRAMLKQKKYREYLNEKALIKMLKRERMW